MTNRLGIYLLSIPVSLNKQLSPSTSKHKPKVNLYKSFPIKVNNAQMCVLATHISLLSTVTKLVLTASIFGKIAADLLFNEGLLQMMQDEVHQFS